VIVIEADANRAVVDDTVPDAAQSLTARDCVDESDRGPAVTEDAGQRAPSRVHFPKLRLAPSLRVHPHDADDGDSAPVHPRLPPTAISAWASEAPQCPAEDKHVPAPPLEPPAERKSTPSPPPESIAIKSSTPIPRWCDDDYEALAPLRLSSPDIKELERANLAPARRETAAPITRPATAPSGGPFTQPQAQPAAIHCEVHAIAIAREAKSAWVEQPTRSRSDLAPAVLRKGDVSSGSLLLRSHAAAQHLRGVLEQDHAVLDDELCVSERAGGSDGTRPDGETTGGNPDGETQRTSPGSEKEKQEKLRLSQASEAERRTLVVQRAM
jgi:hypothetical protein